MNIAGLAGFLLAKTAAGFSRRKTKDWYDVAFVLLHNDVGGTATAVELVAKRFPGEIVALGTALNDLEANFEHPAARGARSYVAQMQIDHPDLDPRTLAADAIIAVGEFCQALRHHADSSAHLRRSVFDLKQAEAVVNNYPCRGRLGYQGRSPR